MSTQEEEFDAQGVLNAAEESDNAYEAINIPVTSEDLPESEDNELRPEPSGGGRVKEQSDESSSSLPSNDEEQLMEEVMSPEQVPQSLTHYEEPYLTVYDNVPQLANEHSNDYVAFLEKIKAMKKSLKTSMIDSSATGIT